MLEESNSAEIIRQVLNTEKMKNFISGKFLNKIQNLKNCTFRSPWKYFWIIFEIGVYCMVLCKQIKCIFHFFLDKISHFSFFKNFLGLFTFEELFEQIKTIHNMFGFNTKYLRYYSRKLQENVNSFNNLLQKLKSDFEISFENLSKEDASLPLQS